MAASLREAPAQRGKKRWRAVLVGLACGLAIGPAAHLFVALTTQIASACDRPDRRERDGPRPRGPAARRFVRHPPRGGSRGLSRGVARADRRRPLAPPPRRDDRRRGGGLARLLALRPGRRRAGADDGHGARALSRRRSHISRGAQARDRGGGGGVPARPVRVASADLPSPRLPPRALRHRAQLRALAAHRLLGVRPRSRGDARRAHAPGAGVRFRGRGRVRSRQGGLLRARRGGHPVRERRLAGARRGAVGNECGGGRGHREWGARARAASGGGAGGLRAA